MFHEAFSKPGADDLFLKSDILPASQNDGRSWKQVRTLPAHLARMCETPLLKPAEEKALFSRMNYAKYRANVLRQRIDLERPNCELLGVAQALMQIAAADRDRIIQANLRLVVSIAKTFANARYSFDDLLSEGITSLLRATEKFDFSRGFRFSTYATQAVRRTLCRHLQQLQRERTRFLNAEAEWFEESSEELTPGTMTEARWNELRRILAKLVGKLDPRERTIIRQRFGLENANPVRTLQSLAKDMGVCKERVRQLEARAMNKLRMMAVEVKLAPPEDA